MTHAKLAFVVDANAKGGKDTAVAVVPVEGLRKNLRNATTALAEVLSDLWTVGQFELSEVTVGLEVTAEGGIQFIGTSKVSGTGSISLKFVPPQVKSPPPKSPPPKR